MMTDANRAEVRCFLRAIANPPAATRFPSLAYFEAIPDDVRAKTAKAAEAMAAAESKADAKSDWKGVRF